MGKKSKLFIIVAATSIILAGGRMALIEAGGHGAAGSPAGVARNLPDGRYETASRARVPFGKIAVFPHVALRVEIAGGRIAKIEMRSPSALAKDARFKAMGDRIIAEQSLDVDVVSGASYSSAAYLAAVAKVVKQ
jgi:uncharacterized protein with FMN-binding domain